MTTAKTAGAALVFWILAVGISEGQQLTDTPGDEIPVSRTVCMHSPSLAEQIKDCQELTGEEISAIFGSLKLKAATEVYQISRKGGHQVVLRFEKKTFAVSPETIGYAIESISSASQVEDLWRLFHPSAKIIQSRDIYKEVITRCERLGYVDILNEIPLDFGLRVQYREEQRDWILHALMFEQKNNVVSCCTYRVTGDGRVGRKIQIFVKGPVVIMGWDEPSDELTEYIRRQEEFKTILDECLDPQK